MFWSLWSCQTQAPVNSCSFEILILNSSQGSWTVCENGCSDCDSCGLASLLRGEQTFFHSCNIVWMRLKLSSGKDVLLLSVGVEHIRLFLDLTSWDRASGRSNSLLQKHYYMYCGRLIFFLNNDQIKFCRWNALAQFTLMFWFLHTNSKVALNVLNVHQSALQFLLWI